VKNLASAKTRTILETADTHLERGKWRQVIVEAYPHHALLRLKGTRQGVTVSWAGMYQHMMRLKAEKLYAEKLAARKAQRAGKKARSTRGTN
jgi:hypothetical protein